jgi:DHA1 family inner membrane transport protein
MERTRAVGALVGLSGGAFLYTIAQTLPVGLLLPMASDLAVSPSRAGMLITVYGAVVVVASVPLTVLARRVPRRLLLSTLLAGFVVSTVVTVLASTFTLVLAARAVTAATHALFWAVVVPAAADLFRPGLRGRVIAVVFAGANLALLLGVPAGTWLGEHAGWRVSFLAVAGLGAVVLLVVASLAPATRPDQGHSARGSTPDIRRFWLLVAVTVLATAGAFAAYTYVAVFVTEVTRLPGASVGAVLLARGAGSMLGILAVGLLVDRSPWLALIATIALQSVALLGLYTFGHLATVAVGLLALTGLAFAAFTAALNVLVLQVAPGRSDLAGAMVSAAMNVGITVGAVIGGLVLPRHGVNSTMLIGALLAIVALAMVAGERLIRPARPRTSPTFAAVTGRPPSSSLSMTSSITMTSSPRRALVETGGRARQRHTIPASGSPSES